MLIRTVQKQTWLPKPSSQGLGTKLTLILDFGKEFGSKWMTWIGLDMSPSREVCQFCEFTV